MTGPAFMQYLIAQTKSAHGTWLEESDPAVELYDGIVRVYDQRGESMSMRRPFPRQLRALATQLQLCADELERRGFEQRENPPRLTPRIDR